MIQRAPTAAECLEEAAERAIADAAAQEAVRLENHAAAGTEPCQHDDTCTELVCPRCGVEIDDRNWAPVREVLGTPEQEYRCECGWKGEDETHFGEVHRCRECDEIVAPPLQVIGGER